MARSLRRDTGLAAAILGLGLLLALTGNILSGQWQSAQRHHQNFSFDLLAGFAASVTGTAIVAWWVLTLVMAFLAALLHRVGASKGATVVSKFSPPFMVRLAIAVLGMNLFGGGLAQASVPPTPEWIPTSSHASTVPSALSPTATGVADSSNATTTTPDPSWRPRPLVVGPGLLSQPGSRGAAGGTANAVEVKAGDSLWSIAASRLAPFSTDVDIAAAWPKWYAANRSVIGDNPAVLLPGQILQPPGPA